MNGPVFSMARLASLAGLLSVSFVCNCRVQGTGYAAQQPLASINMDYPVEQLFIEPKAKTIASNDSTFSLSLHWDVLGPFPIGTRETAWGADPLEHPKFSGFRSLNYSETNRFASALAFNGSVGWSRIPLTYVDNPCSQATSDSSTASEATTSLDLPIQVGFPQIPFDSLRSIYGWAAIQYQAWIRTSFEIHGAQAQHILLWTDGIIEFRVDNEHFFGGDFFSFRHAPTSLRLQPGIHRLEIRLIRDVRSMGGSGAPEITAKMTISMSEAEVLKLVAEPAIVPDYLEHHGFAGKIAAIRLRNDGDNDVRVVGLDVQDKRFETSLSDVQNNPQVIAGQTREISFNLGCVSRMIDGDESISINVIVADINTGTPPVAINVKLHFKVRKLADAHKFTFLHPSGAASYAILEPPTDLNAITNDANLPVLMNLHGAGLEVDSDEVRAIFHPLKPIPFWIVHPAGMTPWSGDDWHSWGYEDAESALHAIQDWIKLVGWEGPGAHTGRYFVIGHSNGGQGTWYALTHRPDQVVGAAAVSGYTSIESYVTFQFWTIMEPAIASVLASARVSYRHELLTDNFADIPVTQQHGSSDDNVPPYHSRNMFQLTSQTGSQPNFLEIAGANHWYDGVMLTEHLKEFYHKVARWHTDSQTELGSSFTLYATPNGEVGSRAGFTVEQLKNPSQLGRIMVTSAPEKGMRHVRLSNVRAFSFKIEAAEDVSGFFIDAQRLDFGEIERQAGGHLASEVRHFRQDTDGHWTITNGTSTKGRGRSRTQLGGTDALLRTKGTIVINYQDLNQRDLAKNLANNLYQYFRADVEIHQARGSGVAQRGGGNIIHLFHGSFEDCGPQEWPFSDQVAFKFTTRELILMGPGGEHHIYPYERGLGLYFLAPIDAERVEMFVWGFTIDDLQRIARLLPTTTGVGQPDFVLLGKDSAWKGANGALAMGFLDCDWSIAPGSFLS